MHFDSRVQVRLLCVQEDIGHEASLHEFRIMERNMPTLLHDTPDMTETA